LKGSALPRRTPLMLCRSTHCASTSPDLKSESRRRTTGGQLELLVRSGWPATENTFPSATLYLRRSLLSCRINAVGSTRRGGLAVIEYFAIYFAVFTVLTLTLIH
jgi:hypothetical protein